MIHTDGELRILAARDKFEPAKFSRVGLLYPPDVWRKPAGYKPTFAVYDMQLVDPRGKRYVMPTLAEQQGNVARKKYYEGGELGDR